MNKITNSILVTCFLAFFSNPVFAFSLESLFQNDMYLINKIVIDPIFLQKINQHQHKEFETTERFLKDPFQRIAEEFKIPKYFYESVFFWFNIYTVYSGNTVVIHDKQNLSIIYKVVDYSELLSSDIGKFTAATMQAYLNTNNVRLIKQVLSALIKKTENFTALEQSVVTAIESKNPGIIPKSIEARSKFFNELLKNIRSQAGQRDAIIKGVLNYIPLETTMSNYFKATNAPLELVAIAFLESSFNLRAISKAGATGTWQFLNKSGRSFMTVDDRIDHRINPLIATFGAIFLLKQNKQILKRWDLGITAYNAGPGHFIKARKKMKLSAPSLELLLEKYEHPDVGFAVKNYYSEFLALVYSLAYKQEIYHNEIVSTEPALNISSDHIEVFIAKGSFIPSAIYKKYGQSSPDLKFLNMHLKNEKRTYPKGTIILSDIELDQKTFKKLSLEKLKSVYPKHWRKL